MLTQPPLSVRRAILTTFDPNCFVHVCSVFESEAVGESLKVLPSLFRTTAYVENQIPLILTNLETLETLYALIILNILKYEPVYQCSIPLNPQKKIFGM